MPRDQMEALLARYEADGDDQVYSEALRLYRQALDDDPNNTELLHGYGYLRECRGRRLLKEAVHYYERCVEVKPDWPKGHFQLISTLASLGETVRAIEKYKNWIRQESENPLGYAYLAASYLKVDQIKEAKLTIKTGLKIAPKHPTLLYWAGEVYARSDQPKNALDAWRQVVTIDETFVDARYSMAFLLERLGRLAEASGEWRAIISFLEKRGYDAESEWPKRELARVEQLISGSR